MDIRPISFCNVAYKLVTKVISDILKPILPNIISDIQGAFTQGRLITNNILIMLQTFHPIRGDTRSNGAMTIKLDMAKAYYLVEWPFLSSSKISMGFRIECVNLVMQCVKSASFYFLVNGFPCGNVIFSRGFRQGDPTSPYVFLVFAEGLLRLLRQFDRKGLYS